VSYTVNLKTTLFSISLNYSIKLKYYITLANTFSSESRLHFVLIRWHSVFPYSSRYWAWQNAEELHNHHLSSLW